jgi:hypothetical protein
VPRQGYALRTPLLWNQKLHYSAYGKLPLEAIMSQHSPVCILQTCISKFNVTPSMHWCLMCFTYLRIFNNFMHFFPSCVTYVPRILNNLNILGKPVKFLADNDDECVAFLVRNKEGPI